MNETLRDKKSTISIVHVLVQHNKTKNIKIGQHSIKEKLGIGQIFITYVSSQDNFADFLTKEQNSNNFQKLHLITSIFSIQ